MKLLEIKDLRTYFKTQKGYARAVDGISFNLDYGETLGLVGESGCGKTTSALSIARLLPEEGEIISGQIILEGIDLINLSEEEMRKKRWKDVSIIFQGAMNALNPVMKVGEQIAEAIVLHQGMKKENALKRAAELLELVELPPDRVNNYPHEFSGGMKQRVIIAMALACNPKVIIGDEPTTALDVMVQAQILNLMEKIQREFKMGFILITHDLSILGETCDRIAIMYAGKIVEIGKSIDIIEKPFHPYTKKLTSYFPDINGKKIVPDGIPGTMPSLIDEIIGCSFNDRCEFAMDICRKTCPEATKLSENHTVFCHLGVNHEQ